MHGQQNVKSTLAFCKVAVYASDRSFAKGSSTECGVSNECDHEDPLGEALTRNRVETPQKIHQVAQQCRFVTNPASLFV